MLKNYFTIALRMLLKNKVFSFINVLGLSTGIASCILIALYVQDEFSYEKSFNDSENVFRINTTFVKDGTEETAPVTSPPIAPGFARELPEIETYTRMMRPLNVEQHLVRYEDKSFFETEVFLVDSTFLDVFPYTLKYGNPSTALDGPSTALLSENMASKLFNDKNPVDELVIINSGTSADTFRITGVVRKARYPSHVDAEIYMCMNSNGYGNWVLNQTTWANNNVVNSYVKLRDHASTTSLEPKFATILDRHAGEELRASGRKKVLTLQALDKIRLYSKHREGSQKSASSITYVYIIVTIGAFILLLACINFMNLTTAKSSQRAGEVGIRKSMGAFRTNLVGQFMGESMVIVLVALFIAFLLVVVALPSFNLVMQKDLALDVDNLLFLFGAAIVIALTTGVLAGSYPALYLSSLKPTQVLKAKNLAGGSHWLRKSLVVVQFVITITLISSIVLIRQQMSFIQSKSLGFESDQVIIVPMRTQSASAQYLSLKTAFAGIAGVRSISAASSLPSTPLSRDWLIHKQGSSNDNSIAHDIVSVDENYFKTLGVSLLAGRDFIADQDNLTADTISTTKIIVNEASLKTFDLSAETAIGSSVFMQAGNDRYEFTIIGVAPDFHHFSLHRSIRPMLFILPDVRNYFPYMAVSVNMPAYNSIRKMMDQIWNERITETPFENIFLNENVKSLYAAEQRTSTLLAISTCVALLISCLGLYGLSVFVAERKTKEIGIRKVVGASVESIVGLLSKEYVKLIIISFFISIPLGYFFMDRWLQGFAYKIEPGMLVFLISGLIAFLIAWLTISFESFRAARRNPSDTLRVN